MSEKNLYLIMAVSVEENGLYGIAKDGSIPWSSNKNISNLDLNIFSATTKMAPYGTKNCLIMGATTWNTLAPGLPERTSIVVSSRKTPLKEGSYLLASSFDEAMELALESNGLLDKESTTKHNKIFAIGGIDIFLEARQHKRYNKEYITVIHQSFGTDRNLNFVPLVKESFHHIIDGIKISYFNYNDYETKDKYNRFSPHNYIYLPDHPEYQYLSLLHFLTKQPLRQTRNAKTRSSFGYLLSFPLINDKGENILPTLTTKKLNLEHIFEELSFFMKGKTQTKELEKKGINIWKANTNKDFLEKIGLPYDEGEMGPMYGYQWRSFDLEFTSKSFDENFNSNEYKYEINKETPPMKCDQFKELIKELKNNPYSRRLLMTTYNPNQADKGVLYPCHGLIVQFYVNDNNQLECMMYQRSADVFLGLPYNIVSYAFLTHIISHCLRNEGIDIKPSRLHISLGDVHLYEDHFVPALKQMAREPLPYPTIEVLSDKKEPWNYEWSDLNINNYTFGPYIKAEMSA